LLYRLAVAINLYISFIDQIHLLFLLFEFISKVILIKLNVNFLVLMLLIK